MFGCDRELKDEAAAVAKLRLFAWRTRPRPRSESSIDLNDRALALID
jgi:hypothetical protein